ncbi:MAG TPA: MFS transporter [Acidiferrobacteraceae bacterium]|nr:MFS transporter [Acidiferrobacteraceae bacterium]
MTSTERRAVGALAGIFGLRLLGLFLILPVLALYAETSLSGATPLLIGLALGAYGLTQALFQIPFGMLSDRWGRKPLIVTGLIIFALGSAVAAVSDSMYGVILGRLIQGMGAIAAVVLALTADLTREEQRTKAMALIGVSIGLVFMLSMVLGTVLSAWVGVKGLFWLTMALALSGILVLYWVPTPVAARRHRDVQLVPAQLAKVLGNPDLLRLDAGIFVLHLTLTAMFVAVPLALVHEDGLPLAAHWKVYLPVFVLSVTGMVPLVILSARKHLIQRIFLVAIALLLAAQALFYFGHRQLPWLVFALWVFFVGFNTLEALLPSTISRVAPADSKGTAMGVYNSFQFFGVFLGGTLGGWLYGAMGIGAVFQACGVLILFWAIIVMTAPAPRLLDTRLLRVGPQTEDGAPVLAKRLVAITGVVEAIVIAEEGMAYLKVDHKELDGDALQQFGVAAN